MPAFSDDPDNTAALAMPRFHPRQAAIDKQLAAGNVAD
jgi:hypothetical protein